jgi:hypothetical protein
MKLIEQPGYANLTVLLLVVSFASSALAEDARPPVKLSRDGNCIERGDAVYSATPQFRSYNTMQACIQAREHASNVKAKAPTPKSSREVLPVAPAVLSASPSMPYYVIGAAVIASLILGLIFW